MMPPPVAPMQPPPPQSRTSGKAIASLVLGIVSVCVPYVGIVTGVLAIVFGVLAMKEADREPGIVKGKGMAIAGLVLGIIAAVLYLLVILFIGSLFNNFAKCIENPDSPACRGNVVPVDGAWTAGAVGLVATPRAPPTRWFVRPTAVRR